MKPGFCYVAEHTEPGRAAQKIIASFGRIGVMLMNPHTRRITELNGDGEQVDITEVDLIQATAVRSIIFQLWISSDTDVSCALRRVDHDRVSHAYSLDGLDSKERKLIMRWAVDYFRDGATEGTAALLVVDPAGVTADVDWDAVVRQETPFPSVCPPILGLPASRIRQLGEHSAYSAEDIAGFKLLRSQAFAG